MVEKRDINEKTFVNVE